MSIELLNNLGIDYIGDKNKIFADKKTFIVVGVARGGTSLIAGTLHHLGVFTGEGSREPVFEDVNLSDVFDKSNMAKAKSIIQEYSSKYDIWCFKRPSSIDYLNKINALCENPVYIFVFKDIFSIANRNKISVKQDIQKGLKEALQNYEKIISFIEQNDINGLFISYEKVLNNKIAFVDTLSKLVGSTIAETKKQSALNFIEPNPKQYLDMSRVTKAKGMVEVVTKAVAEGWAAYLYNDNIPNVELYIDGKLIASMKADMLREDLIEIKQSTHGKVGFSFDISRNDIQDLSSVKVKVSDDVSFLLKKQPEWFNQNQLKAMLHDNYQKPDFLRDTATLLLHKRDLHNADKIISKALELRPTGPAIIQLKQTISEQMEYK